MLKDEVEVQKKKIGLVIKEGCQLTEPHAEEHEGSYKKYIYTSIMPVRCTA